MSLRSSLAGAVPASTATVARAAFPRGTPYLRLRDTLGPVFADQQFAARDQAGDKGVKQGFAASARVVHDLE